LLKSMTCPSSPTRRYSKSHGYRGGGEIVKGLMGRRAMTGATSRPFEMPFDPTMNIDEDVDTGEVTLWLEGISEKRLVRLLNEI